MLQTYDEFIITTTPQNVYCGRLEDKIKDKIEQHVLEKKHSLAEKMLKPDQVLKGVQDHIQSLGLEDFVISYSTPMLETDTQKAAFYVINAEGIAEKKGLSDILAMLGERSRDSPLDYKVIIKELRKKEDAVSHLEQILFGFFFPTNYVITVALSKDGESAEIPINILALTGEMFKENSGCKEKLTKEELVAAWQIGIQQALVLYINDLNHMIQLYCPMKERAEVNTIVGIENDEKTRELTANYFLIVNYDDKRTSEQAYESIKSDPRIVVIKKTKISDLKKKFAGIKGQFGFDEKPEQAEKVHLWRSAINGKDCAEWQKNYDTAMQGETLDAGQRNMK